MTTLFLWLAAGVEGIPIPYSPRMDDGVTTVLLCCFFLSSYVLSRHRKFLLQLIKDFMLHRERNSIFSISTAGDVHSLFLLILQSCVLVSVLLLCHFCEEQPALLEHLPSYALLGIYVAVCVCFLLLKWAVYALLGWIFFDDLRTALWLESYSTLIYYYGFSLFPFVLLAVYFDWPLVNSLFIALIFLSFVKIMTFYKWLKLFCRELYGRFALIVYFCALEVMPCMLVYVGMLQMNESWIIKI